MRVGCMTTNVPNSERVAQIPQWTRLMHTGIMYLMLLGDDACHVHRYGPLIPAFLLTIVERQK